MQSIYDEFAAARVEHLFFGSDSSYLAAARAQMTADPDYNESKYHRAVENSERVLSTLRRLVRLP
jgi:hypothetical protein